MDVQFRQNYTKMILNFYDKFFPGITIHEEGYINVDEIKSVYDDIILSNSGNSEKWDKLEESISSNILRIKTANQNGLIDFYGL